MASVPRNSLKALSAFGSAAAWGRGVDYIRILGREYSIASTVDVITTAASAIRKFASSGIEVAVCLDSAIRWAGEIVLIVLNWVPQGVLNSALGIPFRPIVIVVINDRS